MKGRLMDILFANVTAVTMDEDLRVLFSAFVGVTDGKISYLSREAPEEKPQKRFGLFARGKVAVWEQEVKMKGRFEQ